MFFFKFERDKFIVLIDSLFGSSSFTSDSITFSSIEAPDISLVIACARVFEMEEIFS